jgi:hypothetical protein
MRSIKQVAALLSVAGIAALSACAHKPPAMTDLQVTYACDRAPGIVVVYAGDTARIVTPGSGEDIVLPRKPAESGFWYESATHSIRGKRKQIVYTVGRMVPMTCTAP